MFSWENDVHSAKTNIQMSVYVMTKIGDISYKNSAINMSFSKFYQPVMGSITN